jgi:hypothetical protein
MKLKIEYKNIGRNDFCGEEIVDYNADNMEEGIMYCGEIALEEVKKHLYSHIIELAPEEEIFQKINKFQVGVGFRHVGDVIITLL